MMAQKHLHELLKEDQEPFQLKSYIADRRCQIRGPSEKTQLQIRKRKPITQNSNFPSNFCKNACFFSFNDSPDPRKSPMFEFSSPIKSPCRSPKNAIFLKIPAKTAALLLEAALRIQKSKQKNENKISSGLFGSLKRKLALTHRNRSRKREKDDDGVVKPSVKDILRWDSSVGRRKSFKEKNEVVGSEEKTSACDELGFSCSCNGRPSSAVWSESNEDKSLDLDLETSSSSQSNDSEEEDVEFASCEKRFCESPFRFVLERSPSCGRRTPDFSSPVTSPTRRYTEDRDDHDQIEILKKLQVESEEEGKEQCSPVSVLDPPFEDDDEGHLDDDDDDEVDGCDLNCSYEFVQRAKQQLLHKLRRFERLAELDPIELEKRMLEEEEEDLDDEEFTLEDEGEEGCIGHKEYKFDGLIKEVFSNSSFNQFRRIPEDMKRLVSDLIEEEEREEIDEEVVVKRVCRRLESWKEVESNTIDMMVEQDFRTEYDAWKRNQEQVGETAIEIELAILGLLFEELSEEFVV